jgi:hypothetical protein
MYTRKVSYLAALYRPRTNSFAVHEFPEGEAFNFELESHIFMANDKVMKLGGGFLPLGYSTIEYVNQVEKEALFNNFFEQTVKKLNEARPIPPCDVPTFEPPNEEWS